MIFPSSFTYKHILQHVNGELKSNNQTLKTSNKIQWISMASSAKIQLE